MKYLLIANPVSGKQDGDKKILQVTKYFRKFGDTVVLRLTRYPGHAAEIADKYSGKDFDAVIGAGGDGTINEVLNGMIGSKTPLAILPWGTGNVFAREMGFPHGLKKICRMIRKGRTMKLDAGKCGKRAFLLMTGAGFDAYSLKQIADGSMKKNLGLFAYVFGVLGAFSRYRYPDITVELDDGTIDRGSFILVSNTSRYGAFFSFTPRALPVDGFLDVFVFRDSGLWNTLKMAFRLLLEAAGFLNPHDRAPFQKKIGVYRAKKITIQSDEKVYTQLDGELYKPLPVQIRVEPKAIKLILPGRTIRKIKDQKKKDKKARRHGKLPSIQVST